MTKADIRTEEILDHYDVVIIGGGIYGATMALEAITRGLTVLMVERSDFASSTSSNSLKVIHGGIRYLQTVDLIRMRESIRERRAFLRIVPHLVTPLKCIMPTYKEIKKSKLIIYLGFLFYRLMSFDKNTGLDESRKLSIGKLISRVKFKGLFPDVRDNSITGGAVWSDAQAYNSERLVLSFIMSAIQRGAHVYNYMHYEKPIIEDHRISGVILRDRFSGKSYDIKTDSVIDCTGPWNNNSDYYKKLMVKNELVLAVNIVLKNRILDYALGIKIPYETAGGITERLLFFTPWRNTTIIGTWYSICNQPPGRLSFDKEELKECLKQINSIFKRELISFDDIAYVHKGLLPVESQDRIKPEANLKNRPEIIHAQEQGGVGGHFLVQGVKYTTARNVAEFTINKILKYLKKPVMRSVTDELYLYGANYDSFGDWKRLQIEKYTGIHSNEIIDRLICNYGSNIESILGIAKSKSVLSELVPGTKLVLKAEIEYVLENEMTYTLSDLLLRRTDIGTLGLPTVETIKYCIDMLFKKHNWVDGDIKKNIKEFLTFYPEWIVSDYKTRFQI